MNQFLNVPESNKVSIYLSSEDWKFLQENYIDITGSEEPLPFGKFFLKCALKAVSVMKSGSNPDDKKLIADLEKTISEKNEYIATIENDFFQLKNDVTADQNSINDDVARLQAENANLISRIELQKQTIVDKDNEIARLQENTSGSVIDFDFKENEIKVIDSICEAESKRTGEDVTRAKLLKNIFFFVLINGPHDMFSVPPQIRKMREMLQL